MMNDKSLGPVTAVILLFLSGIVGCFFWEYFMTSMHEACRCVDSSRWWPFRVITSLASATVYLAVFYTLRSVVVRWVKRKA